MSAETVKQRSIAWPKVVSLLYVVLGGPLVAIASWIAQTFYPFNAAFYLITATIIAAPLGAAVLYLFRKIKPGRVALWSSLAVIGIVISWFCPFIEKGHSDARVLVMSSGSLLVCCLGLVADLVRYGRSKPGMRLR